MLLCVRGGEVLDYSSLELACVAGEATKVQKQWLHRLRSLYDGRPGDYNHEVPLVRFLEQTVGEAKVASLVSQVVHRLSLRIEGLIAKRLQTAGHARSAGNSRIEVSWEDGSAADYDWVAKLPAYLLAGVVATEMDQEISLSTDKAWVGGLPIQNTSFLTQAGVAIIGIPVVPPGGAMGLSHRAISKKVGFCDRSRTSGAPRLRLR